MFEGTRIVKSNVAFEPDVGTLPIPVHPVQANLVPGDPETDELTDAATDSPSSSQRLPGSGIP